MNKNNLKSKSEFEISKGSLDVKKEKIEKLKELMPEVFTESNKLDVDKLKKTLGEFVNDENERYVLNWAGKNESFKVLQTQTTATLAPDKEESINFDTTENIFIEGENLEVLKVLQKSYHNKIKMIYIDPPYNTGNDSFIYPDKFEESKSDYLKRIGEKDEEGFLLKEGLFRKNSKENGQYHSNWLSMIYPRLFLARNLLKDDGVIFVSIDDNEVHNLRMVMNEIFGEENFLAEFVWRRRTSSALAERLISVDHEYLIAYQKLDFSFLGNKKNYANYKNPDNDPNGPWMYDNPTVGMNKDQRPNQFYDLIDPETGNIFPANPNRVWAWAPPTMEKLLNSGRIIFPKDSSKRPMFKKYKKDLKSEVNPISSLLLEVGLNSEATKAIQDLFNGSFFSYSKPLSLLKSLISNSSNSNDLILDFFAGSGTTAQAVLELNKEDQGNRKFILVQMPEKTAEDSEAYKAGYETIADICKERVRRVIGNLTSGVSNLTPDPSPKERGDSLKRKGDSLSLFGKDKIENKTPGYVTADSVTYKKLKPFTLENRKNQTEAEAVMWNVLRNKKLGKKFRRQHLIEKYIVDFVCLEEKLIVEIDGGYHDQKDQKEYDTGRSEGLYSLGYDELRFTNEEVLKNLDAVIETIKHFIDKHEIKYSKALNRKKNSSILNHNQYSPLLWRGAGGEVDKQIQNPPTSGREVDNSPGFKVFKLKNSNFKLWRGDNIENGTDLSEQLDAFKDPVKKGAEDDNIVYELMLKSGMDLNLKVEKETIFIESALSGKPKKDDKLVSGNFSYYKIDNGKLIIFTEASGETGNFIKELLKKEKPEKVICLDRIFDGDDETKTNLVLQMRDAGVEFKTV
ncbi:MAG: DUF559 domain-containing protein [Bacteroidetes bacterium]|nr:DUF559 domain-containing protein [Bacteroidota bacterium]